MAATITFRPRAGIREALDARCANGQPDRTSVINAALAAYLNVAVPDDTQAGTDETQARRVSEPPRGARASGPRRARQAVPTPAGEAPPCPHPKKSRKVLQYGTQCTECGQMVKP